MEDDRKNKRKQPSSSVDFTDIPPSPTNAERSITTRPVISARKKMIRVSPIELPINDHQIDVNDNEKLIKKEGKFRPKVMENSPISPSPETGDSWNWYSSTVKPSCRRVLDFGSAHTGTKTTKVFTKGGFCFNREVNKHMESGQQKSLCNAKEDDEWWKNEQELFRQRALSFIRSMRLVQGNRPFTGWKGSVVDSVVGVFLAQNVSDNLSSSAFMSLAAKYPNEIIRDPNMDDHTEHAINWNAIRCAQPDEISHAIQERGMNNRLAARIMKFLDSIHDNNSGLLDLEWLRNANSINTMGYLAGVYGLGIKSIECLRLLTLRQRAFPVDTNVSRIVVRLGWVPIEKLPDGVLIHELGEYPDMNHVQEYLSHRLSNLDVETLYELHYQMITFGKVFCTKKNPNCDSCPLKNDCKHFASAFSSNRCLENTFIPITPEKTMGPTKPVLTIPTPGWRIKLGNEQDIEDLFLEPKVHPMIIKTKELMTNVWNYNIPLKKDDISRALVNISAEETSRPVRKLKNVGRSRTEHQIYELPDSHPLIQALERRDPDDRHPYILAIWPQGETDYPSSDSQGEETVFGTILVPCRTATRGSFPLDGTFFQINEVFADDESSEKPLVVPRNLLWDLTRKTLFCGTSIATIFKGMSTLEIQECFWKGYVCIRGFNMKTRAPRPLHQRFHPSKIVKVYGKGRSPTKKDHGTNK